MARMQANLANPDDLGERLPILDGGGSLRLRALAEGDAGAGLELFGDPEVFRFTSIRRLASEAEARDFIAGIGEGFLSGILYQWGIELEREVVGTCTLAAIDRRHRRAELGFAVLRRWWGRRARCVRPDLDRSATLRYASLRIAGSRGNGHPTCHRASSRRAHREAR